MKPLPVPRRVTEADVEAYLRKRVKELGGECYKWASANVRGVPDRICIFPGGAIHLIEVKSPTGKLTALQNRFFGRMVELRFNHWRVIKSKESVDEFIQDIGL